MKLLWAALPLTLKGNKPVCVDVRENFEFWD